MTYGPNESIEAFLSAASSKQPVPGGGSVTALVGALAASMGEMTLQYSVGRKSSAAHDPELKAALLQLSHARMMLLELMVEDQDAYQALRDAKKLPDDAPGKAEIPQLVNACVNVPQSIGATAAAILTLAEKVAPIVNPYLLSDLAVCADLAMATVRCASYNVLVNLPELPDDAARNRARAEADTLVKHSIAAVQRANAAIWTQPTP